MPMVRRMRAVFLFVVLLGGVSVPGCAGVGAALKNADGDGFLLHCLS